ncbi:NTP pyrophosphatase (non-canonical NTP hydrolase) [Kitasatospora sp. GAS204A]|nr:NTP pyrophosphatase (non-canonical NTP hydrolase) [Kitasatospora sp. GAS204B]
MTENAAPRPADQPHQPSRSARPDQPSRSARPDQPDRPDRFDQHERAAVPPTLGELAGRLSDFAAARRWQPFHTPKNLAAALTVEAGELLEIFQWLTPEQAAAVMDDPKSAHRVRDEVADVLAYLLQFCTAVGVDPLVALDEKIDRNELRFPAAPRE